MWNEFLQEPGWGALVVSAIALVQPWVGRAWRRFVRRGELEVHETGNIEVSFGTFGPGIGLIGTLRALHHDVFIRRASVTLTRLEDSAQNRLSWRAFRPNTVRIGGTGSDEVLLQPASSFLLSAASPVNYNVFFGSDAFVADHAAAASAIPQLWNEFVERKINALEPDLQERARAALREKWLTLTSALWKDFLATDYMRKFYHDLTTGFFWRAGEYRLELRIECASPARPFCKTWRFALSEADADELHVNVVSLQRELAGLPPAYRFAYPQYCPDSST